MVIIIFAIFGSILFALSGISLPFFVSFLIKTFGKPMNGDPLWAFMILTVPAGFFYGAIWGRKFGLIFNEVNLSFLDAMKTIHFLKGLPFIIAGFVSLAYLGNMKFQSIMKEREIIKNPNVEVSGYPAIFSVIPVYYSYPKKEIYHEEKEKKIRAMIDNGLNLEAEYFKSERPIHYAAVNHQWRMVLIFLKAGADPLAADQDGNSLITLIKNQKREPVGEAYREVISILMKAGHLKSDE